MSILQKKIQSLDSFFFYVLNSTQTIDSVFPGYVITLSHSQKYFSIQFSVWEVQEEILQSWFTFEN